jgi:hypothetical protein
MATYIFPGVPVLDHATVRSQIVANVGPLCEDAACNHSRAGHYVDGTRMADEAVHSDAYGWDAVLHPDQPSGNGLTIGAMNTNRETETVYVASWAIFHNQLSNSQLEKLKTIMTPSE